MESNLAEYLEYLCSENDDLSSLLIVNNEGFTIASSISGSTDRTLVSGMCTAIKCISKELIQETMNSNLKRLMVDCTEGFILIQPLDQKGTLVASCKSAVILRDLDIPSIKSYFYGQKDHLIAL
ncbi:MAG: roadblock/LC7 domain-containing protein [Promethearchaeota archaeon]|jgi:predicted regulator of Ras-like GTPase activity (Roadblock/LC7/MglB family)